MGGQQSSAFLALTELLEVEKMRRDYAEIAAREWFTPETPLICLHGEQCKQCDAIHKAYISMEQNLQQLAAIIRNHVEDYKYEHSWSCTDKECCPNG